LWEGGKLKKLNKFFDRQQRISWWNQKRLSKARILVIGAGALGNEVIKNLALLGVGNILIVDFDVIEDSNLSRAVLFRSKDARKNDAKAKVAAMRAKTLNPNRRAKINHLFGNVVSDLGLGVYRYADVIVGCLDNIEARLAVNKSCWKLGKTWIDGGMWELSGSVSVYDGSVEEKACYECGMTPDHYRNVKKRYSCTNAVVKTRIKLGYEPTTQITSAVIGAVQSQEVVKILHDLPSFSGRRLMFSGSPHSYIDQDTNPTYMIDLAVNENCLCHEEKRIKQIINLDNMTNDTTLEGFFENLHKVLGNDCLTIDLKKSFVTSSICPLCEKTIEVNKPIHMILDTDIVCPSCQVVCPSCKKINIGVPDCVNCGQVDILEPILTSFTYLSEQDPWAVRNSNLRLRDIGIPSLDILTVKTTTNIYFVELSGDYAAMWR
jgi:adenylyltransferase/sulfurtransferase